MLNKSRSMFDSHQLTDVLLTTFHEQKTKVNAQGWWLIYFQLIVLEHLSLLDTTTKNVHFSTKWLQLTSYKAVKFEGLFFSNFNR